MATTLTKNYQRIATISLSLGKIYTYAKYTEQTVSGNRVKTTYKIKSEYTLNSGTSYISFSSATAKLDGTSKSYGSTTINGTTIIQELTRSITHNEDGTSPTKSISTSWSATYGGSGSSSGSIKAPTKKVLATVTAGTDFTDESNSNPTIRFDNPSSMSVRPYLNFWTEEGGTLVHQILRDIGTYTSPYPWSLTTQERNDLLSACNTKTVYVVTEGLDTYNGSTKLGYHAVVKNFTITNAKPLIGTPAFQEMNSKAVTYLGTSASNVIQNISQVKITVIPTAVKGATITSVKFANSGVEKIITSTPYTYTFSNIQSGDFTITVTDSRGLSTSQTYSKNLITYQPVKQNSFSFTRESTISPDVNLELESVYYNSTFGSNPNVPTVKYKIGNDNWNTLTEGTDYTVDNVNHIISVDYTIENAIAYDEQPTVFYVEVSDLLTSWNNQDTITKSYPVMELGDNEVQINGDLLLADSDRDNIINVRDALGGGGTTDYSLLTNKPQINGVTLSGNKSSSDLGITIPTNYVTTDTTQDITGAKTFKNVMKVQNGQGTGSLWIGGDVNANTLTNNTRHLARLSVPSYSDITLGSTLLGFDSSGDTNMNVTNKGSDVVSFGGMKKITNATSPMAIGFCVANTRNGTTANQKVYPMEMDSSEVRFNVQPNYNGTNLATMNDIPSVPTKTSDLTNDSGFISGITSSDVTTALGYTPEEEIPLFNLHDTSRGKVIELYNYATSGKLFRLYSGLSENNYYYDVVNTFVDDTNDTVSIDIIDKDKNIQRLAITYTGSGNPTRTLTTIGLQEKITSSNKLDYSLLDNTPTIPTSTSQLTNDSGFITSSYHDSTKQDTLVSGTNIKTINNTSLLGSGNITIGGGGTATDVQINGTSITSGGEANIITEGTYDSSTNKIATMSDVPTKTSDLTNDSRFITSSDLPQDSGWSNITTSRGTWVYLRYRIIGKQLYLEGRASSLSYSGSATKIGEMPSGTLPSTGENHYFYGHLAGGRIARILVNTSGEIIVDWARNISDGNTYTSSTWYSFSTSYYIN